MMKYTFAALFFILSLGSQAQKVVSLDNWYNHEVMEGTGQVYHYTWTDTTNSGFSKFGDLFREKGASIQMIPEKPTKSILGKTDIYIIVDPDTTTENPSPNYILPEEVKVISDWVRKGGVLLLMANDAPNCEFTHFNRLASAFGFHFNAVTLNPVTDKNWEMGAETNLPDHPLFKGVSKIYMKEVASITIGSKMKPVLKDGNNTIIAESRFGKGFVLAIGDPWIYNEYIGNDRLPKDFENMKAAGNLCNYLLSKTK